MTTSKSVYYGTDTKKLNIPIQVLWGKKGVVGTQFKSVKIWQKYTNKKSSKVNAEYIPSTML